MEVKPLRQSSVPAGYRQTEVGVIPKEWEVISLAELSAFITKGSTPTTYGFKWEQSGVLFLRSECVSDDGLDLDKSMFISKAAHSLLRRSEVCDGDVLITITGNVGRVVRLSRVGVANLNQHIARVRVTTPNADGQYVFHILSQPCVRKRFGSITTGQAYPQISLQQVRDARIPLPPLQEQRAIAGALSDVDALIGALDQLIAKKRDLKLAVMQQLLTGQKRLPGFHGEWEVKRLGEISTIATGNTPPTRDAANYGDDFLFVSPVDLGEAKHVTSTEKKLSKKGFAISRRFPKDTILFVCIGSTIGKCGVAPIELTSNQQINAIFPSPNFSVDYLYYFLCTAAPKIRSLAGEQAVPIVNKTLFSETAVALPLLPEQTAIAEVLSDLDAELAALEQRRDKTRALKQGMMQELLTGRTRLV